MVDASAKYAGRSGLGSDFTSQREEQNVLEIRADSVSKEVGVPGCESSFVEL